MYIYIYIYTYSFVCLFICICMCIYIYIYIYTLHKIIVIAYSRHLILDLGGFDSMSRSRPGDPYAHIICIYVCMYVYKCRDSIVVMVVGLGYEGPGFNPDRCQVYGLRVRHFKVSGGAPSPPEKPQLVLDWKIRGVKQTRNVYIYIYIYMYTHIHTHMYVYV